MPPEIENKIGNFAQFYSAVDTGILKFVSGLNLPEYPLVREIIKEMIGDIKMGQFLLLCQKLRF